MSGELDGATRQLLDVRLRDRASRFVHLAMYLRLEGRREGKERAKGI